MGNAQHMPHLIARDKLDSRENEREYEMLRGDLFEDAPLTNNANATLK